LSTALLRQGDKGIEIKIERGACQPGYRETGRSGDRDRGREGCQPD
jgi:hypothetical protein